MEQIAGGGRGAGDGLQLHPGHGAAHGGDGRNQVVPGTGTKRQAYLRSPGLWHVRLGPLIALDPRQRPKSGF